MPPVVPDPKRIRSFANAKRFEAWLSKHHDRETELWLKFHKKGSGLPTVTYAEALDVALCWGWIDGLRKSAGEHSFLQRFTPRQPRSIWSQVNKEHVLRLIEEGRMTPHGRRQVDAAIADGRWEAAYAPIRATTEATVPDDLRAAIEADEQALAVYRTLGRQNLFIMSRLVESLRTPAGRRRKIEALVAMLARGETVVPERPRQGKKEEQP